MKCSRPSRSRHCRWPLDLSIFTIILECPLIVRKRSCLGCSLPRFGFGPFVSTRRGSTGARARPWIDFEQAFWSGSRWKNFYRTAVVAHEPFDCGAVCRRHARVEGAA